MAQLPFTRSPGLETLPWVTADLVSRWALAGASPGLVASPQAATGASAQRLTVAIQHTIEIGTPSKKSVFQTVPTESVSRQFAESELELESD